jgi:hypothetical protein
VHARRGLESARETITHDAASMLASARKVAPYLPAVAKWAASEGLGMLPAITQNLRASVQSWLEPSAQQKAEITRAQTAPEPSSTVQLRMPAKRTAKQPQAMATSA